MSLVSDTLPCFIHYLGLLSLSYVHIIVIHGCRNSIWLQSDSRSQRMQRSFPFDTAGQLFIKELYDKETGTRLRWHSQNQAQTNDDSSAAAAAGLGPSTATVSRQHEVFRKKVEAACPKPTEALMKLKERYQSVSHHKRIRNFDERYQIEPTMKDEDLVEMIPPEDQVRRQLYDGISRDGKGRLQYLRTRNLPSPDSKYRRPVVSSWEYGWNMSDIVKREDVKKPEFGRKRLIRDSFYTRNGVTTLHVPAIH